MLLSVKVSKKVTPKGKLPDTLARSATLLTYLAFSREPGMRVVTAEGSAGRLSLPMASATIPRRSR